MIFFKKIANSKMLLLVFCLALCRCKDTIDIPRIDDVDLTSIPYNPNLYIPIIPFGFPALEQPSDNPMTFNGIALGRKLFYDPILSVDSTISCASCHKQEGSFTDNLPVSLGVAGTTSRSAIGLLNVGFHYHGLFWDGRAPNLEMQAVQPVENKIEMGETWGNVELKLKRHPQYPTDFRKAFGISRSSMITKDLATKAVSQFERTIMSSGNSKYDRFRKGEIFLDDDEYTGYLMFFNIDRTFPDAQCGHCHTDPLFGSNDYFNNGLQESADFEGFTDKGLGAITGIPSDNGKFKTPTLRNLAFTAPYMHDGRFNTIEEVIDHYNSGGKYSPNKSPFLNAIHLTQIQKTDLIAFLKTLTDSTIVSNLAFKNPF